MNPIRMVIASLVFVLAMTALVAQSSEEPSKSGGKQFVICVYETAEEFKLRTDTTEKGANYWKGWGIFRDELVKANILRGGLPLQRQSTSRTVKFEKGKPVTSNGPVAASNPELSGFFIIEVTDMDEALKWAAKVPNAANGIVEVRCGDWVAIAAMSKN